MREWTGVSYIYWRRGILEKSWWVVMEVDGRLAVVDERVELARAGLG